MVKIGKSGKNSTNALYNETTKPEKFFNLKKTLKMQKLQNNYMVIKVMQTLLMLIF